MIKCCVLWFVIGLSAHYAVLLIVNLIAKHKKAKRKGIKEND